MTREVELPLTSTFAKCGVSYSADRLVEAKSLVLRIKICGNKPAHRKQAYDKDFNLVNNGKLKGEYYCEANLMKVSASPQKVKIRGYFEMDLVNVADKKIRLKE